MILTNASLTSEKIFSDGIVTTITNGNNFPYNIISSTTTSTSLPPSHPFGSYILPRTVERTNEEDYLDEEFIHPKCGICRTEITSIVTYRKNSSLTLIFQCHEDERRIDISLKAFKENELDAKKYVYSNNEWMFTEESKWQLLKPKIVLTENADKQAITKWLEN